MVETGLIKLTEKCLDMLCKSSSVRGDEYEGL